MKCLKNISSHLFHISTECYIILQPKPSTQACSLFLQHLKTSWQQAYSFLFQHAIRSLSTSPHNPASSSIHCPHQRLLSTHPQLPSAQVCYTFYRVYVAASTPDEFGAPQTLPSSPHQQQKKPRHGKENAPGNEVGRAARQPRAGSQDVRSSLQPHW